MKKILPIIIILIIFLIGVGIISYPLVSSVVNNIDMRNAAGSYIEKAKTMRDNDRALLVNTANGKEFVFTYIAPGVWDICSVKYYKRRTKQ